MITNCGVATAGAIATHLTATCAGCGAVVPADQVMCSSCATR